MSYQEDSFRTEGEQKSQQRFQMIDTLKAPIIEMGRNLGYEVVENYDLGAGPIHVFMSIGHLNQVQNRFLI